MEKLFKAAGAALLSLWLSMGAACAMRQEVVKNPLAVSRDASDSAIQPSRIVIIGKPDESPDDVGLKERLRRPVTIKASTLEAMVAAIREQADVEVMINWPALEAGDVKPDLDIALDFKSVPADQALTQISKFASDSSLERLDWSVHGGVARFSTYRDLIRFTQTRLYILPAPGLHPRWRGPREAVDLNEALRSAGPAPKPPAKLNDIELPDGEFTYDESMEEIITLIRDTVGPSWDWVAYGGEVSSIRDMHGVLVVRTSPDRHAEIELLLAMLFQPGPWAGRSLALDEASLLVARADALRMNQRYAQAMRCIDIALCVAPDHARALAMKRVLEGALRR